MTGASRDHMCAHAMWTDSLFTLVSPQCEMLDRCSLMAYETL